MSAKFPRGGGGANPFSAIRLIVFVYICTFANQLLIFQVSSIWLYFSIAVVVKSETIHFGVSRLSDA